MDNMQESMAYPSQPAALDMPAWKTVAATACAILLAVLFASAGVWKITDPIDWSAKLTQMKVPGPLALPFTLALGIGETFAAVLLLVPRFRRWGAWLTAIMLVAFMAYVGINYTALTGADCSCFPWLKRSIGPGFFWGDAAMLAAAGLAGWWARKSEGLKGAALVLGVVSVFAAASYGVAASRNTGTKAPETITVNGQPYSLTQGKVFLYFFDPECSHCYQAAQLLGTHNWKDTRLVAIPTRVPQFAQGFLETTKFNAGVSNDLELLKKTFPHGDPPYGVALENGRQKAAFAIFDSEQPRNGLRELGYIQ
jgi:uncharacterized membrane protein YphA (DoxX/SURF4 family)